MHAMPQASIAFTARAQALATAGDLTGAAACVDHALAIRSRNPTLSPWPTMHHLLVAARVAVDAGTIPRALGLLHETAVLMDRFPSGMGVMRARLASVYTVMPPVSEVVALEKLTEREIDVLRLLQGSLNLSEIARELYVSHNTVKTHTLALYRKLGASSRAEAVRIGRSLQLV
jgi:LuxR family maltose regulon positive regulatory protein